MRGQPIEVVFIEMLSEIKDYNIVTQWILHRVACCMSIFLQARALIYASNDDAINCWNPAILLQPSSIVREKLFIAKLVSHD